MHRLLSTLGIVVMLSPVSASAQGQNWTSLEGEPARQALAGKTFDFVDAQRNRGTIVFRADGTRSVQTGSFTDEGVWEVRGKQLCGAWRKLRQGQETCSELIRLTNGDLEAYDQRGQFTTRLTNPR